jgi:hypothetical protein
MSAMNPCYEGTMNIFISWSGEASHTVAKALKSWLPDMFQALSPDDVFLSSQDVAVGTQWFAEMGKVLEKSTFGILCLTHENLTAPWMLYEAGAIAKQLESARVAPLLIGVAQTEVPSPLCHLQGAMLDRDGAKKLVESINAQLGANKLSEKKLGGAFNAFWPQLEPTISAAAISAAKGSYAHDVFLSTPMAAYKTDAEYAAARTEFKKVFDALKEVCGLRVYWAAEKIESMSDFDSKDISVLDDLKALDRSRTFILLYPKRLPTSSLFEAGYALALKRMSHYFVPKRELLPFLMRELAGPSYYVRIHDEDEWRTYDDLALKLCKNKDRWF